MTPDRMAFVLQLMAILGATVGVIAICAAVIAVAALNRAGDRAAEILAVMSRPADLLQMLAVIVIGLSAFVLRLLDQINDDAVMAALTGIAGYVLGGLSSGRGGGAGKHLSDTSEPSNSEQG